MFGLILHKANSVLKNGIQREIFHFDAFMYIFKVHFKSATENICEKAGTWYGLLACIFTVNVIYKFMALYTYAHLRNAIMWKFYSFCSKGQRYFEQK